MATVATGFDACMYGLSGCICMALVAVALSPWDPSGNGSISHGVTSSYLACCQES